MRRGQSGLGLGLGTEHLCAEAVPLAVAPLSLVGGAVLLTHRALSRHNSGDPLPAVGTPCSRPVKLPGPVHLSVVEAPFVGVALGEPELALFVEQGLGLKLELGLGLGLKFGLGLGFG